MTKPPLLILGGTTLAAELASALTERGVPLVYSLAGRTVPKALPGVNVRSGGFGGTQALADYLHEANIGAVIDATHAYAAQISINAIAACRTADRPLLRLQPPPWQSTSGDDWRNVPNLPAARQLAAGIAHHVFVSTGRQGMDVFADDASAWWLARVIAPGDDLPALRNGQYIFARGPFDLAAERDLLREHRIDAVISKNAGGDATYGKIAAARDLGLPVIMVDRPECGDVPAVEAVDEALSWIQALR